MKLSGRFLAMKNHSRDLHHQEFQYRKWGTCLLHRSATWDSTKMEEPCASWLLFLKKFAIGKLQAFCQHGARAMLSSGVNGVPIGVIRASSPEPGISIIRNYVHVHSGAGIRRFSGYNRSFKSGVLRPAWKSEVFGASPKSCGSCIHTKFRLSTCAQEFTTASSLVVW